MIFGNTKIIKKRFKIAPNGLNTVLSTRSTVKFNKPVRAGYSQSGGRLLMKTGRRLAEKGGNRFCAIIFVADGKFCCLGPQVSSRAV
jgi:hypothetical protein